MEDMDAAITLEGLVEASNQLKRCLADLNGKWCAIVSKKGKGAWRMPERGNQNVWGPVLSTCPPSFPDNGIAQGQISFQFSLPARSNAGEIEGMIGPFVIIHVDIDDGFGGYLLAIAITDIDPQQFTAGALPSKIFG